MMTSAGETGWLWLHKLSARLERVRIIHGDWSRCLNCHYGGRETAIFFDPPYKSFEGVYANRLPVAEAVADWCRENPSIRIAICGHSGDYDLPGWDAVKWNRQRETYGSNKTRGEECVWYSPACMGRTQTDLFG